ncbi:hypothetical protein [Xanthomonas prunicola]|nr:hypothetical protein [Xanthomonas prunicola]
MSEKESDKRKHRNPASAKESTSRQTKRPGQTGIDKLDQSDMELMAGGQETGTSPPITVTATPPTTVTGNPPSPPITVTSNPPSSGNPGSPPPPPPGCPPATPSSDWAAQDQAVKDALQTAQGDQSGVDRAIDDWETVASAANAHNIDPAMLAAIGIRETNFRDINQNGGGLGRGVFQIDLGAHPDVTEAQANDLSFAANYAANILQQNQATLAAQYPNFTAEQLQQATAASYNFGTGNISGNPETIDQGTSGNNYGSNIQALMPAFKDPVTGLTPKAGTSNGGKDGC